MPWCATCDRFLSPPSVRADGTCPTCGRAVDPGRAHAPEAAEASAPVASTPVTTAPPEDAPPAPWHLKVLLVSVGLYIAYRMVGMAEWVWHRFAG